MTNPVPLDWQAAEATAKHLTTQWAADEPGGAVIGFDASGICFSHAGGVESLATFTPFTVDSVVRYASLTKHVFSAMVLAHHDIIGLGDTLGQHLPELRPPLANVTVGQALDMSGGLPDTRECLSLLGLSVYTETKAGPLLDYISRLERLNFDAGSEVSYSNTGYRLVEAALERKGFPFDDFVQRQIAGPLGIGLKAPDTWNDPIKGLVPGYWQSGESWQLSAAGLHISASGSLTGSAKALVIWLQAVLNDEGDFAGLLDRLQAARVLADGRPTGYGLGLRKSWLGARAFVGHGGSHPGYKTYFLLDPETQAGFVVVSNREDTNGHKIALESMAALTGLALPVPASDLGDGFYVTETGPWWVEIKGSTCTYLDADETLYDDGEGWASSRSASSPVRLRRDGPALVGEVGHAARRFLPARTGESVPASLSGVWRSDEGAEFAIDNGTVVMGIGPIRQALALSSLGSGRFLFTLNDGPWVKRICLHLLGPDRLELVTSRARMIEFRRSA
ncbi:MULTISPECIES: serine hydrolase domain-containing protein [unclassified Ensifer]|uniref:serine hydrolase domain-containing protein n=1 Tax=unclassified Ensifer TaxID=2633371 RepID=UPI00081304C6|nr:MULTISPECIES: serine hydrolase domain-containing protein [unclassified Ensifer]OCP00442.1 serine hydrolase [Ensifer sp. LC13]OCP00445.1 serine hydrolase [Ensifer sp. LC11]OCP10316.1 serine hydrolase [Ensifer sp. LC14]OCP29475.1 serine hydrolase [Ensifer sp. LC499]